MKKLLLVLFLLSNCFQVVFAGNYTDSLRSIILTYEQSKANGVELVDKYIALSEQLTYSNPDEAKLLIEKALGLAKSLKQKSPISDVYYQSGRYYLSKNLYSRALDEYFKAYQYLLQNNEAFRTGYILIDIGNVYYNIGNLNVSFNLYLRARKVFEGNGDQHGLSVALNNIGLVYTQKQQYDSAEVYFHKALDIRKLISKYRMDIALGYYYLAITNKAKGNPEKAFNYADLSLTMMKGADSTTSFNQKMLADCFRIMAELNVGNKNLKGAEECYLRSIQHHTAQGDFSSVAGVENELATFYSEIKDFDKAILLADRAFMHAVKGNSLREQASSCFVISFALVSLNKKSEALLFLTRYEKLQDSLINHINSKIFSETQVAIQTMVKEKENEYLRKESKAWQYIYLVIILVLLLIISLSLLLYRNKRKDEKRFRELSNSTFEGIFIHDGFKIIDCNEKMLKLLGVNVLKQIPDFDKKHVSPRFSELFRKKLVSENFEEFELELLDSGGHAFPVEIQSKDFDQKKGWRIFAVRELTAKKQAEYALQESRRRLATLLENLPGIAYVCRNDKNWTMEFISKGCYELTGYQPEDIIGNSRIAFNDLIVPEYQETIWNEWQDVLSKRGFFEGEYPIIKANGEIIWVWERGCGVFSENDQLIALEGFITDITARRNSLDEIRQHSADLKEANITKDKFFSIIAHDLKGPLHAIMGFSELLYEGYADYQEVDRKRYIKNIFDVSGHLNKLLQNLLEWSRSRTGRIEFRPSPVFLGVLLNNITALFKDQAAAKDIVIFAEVPAEIRVQCDENMISTVLRNLISNAVKFTFQKGRILVRAIVDKKQVIISVTDNGIGIPEPELAKIFLIEEVFKREGTAQEKGTGLGLILCREFVERHGGEIWVESIEGQGTSFFFSLPLSK
jgi:PAS domain S-box-containing protein